MQNSTPPDEADNLPAATPVSIIVEDNAGAILRIEGLSGDRLLDVLMRAQADVAPICYGRVSCGGCRVRIEKFWRDRVTPCGRRERSVLRYVDDPHEDDRLSCQIALTVEIDGLVVKTSPKFTASPD